MKDKVIYGINDVISSLDDKNSAMVQKFHEQAVHLGCTGKISTMGKKTDDWKCEYTIKKPKRSLFIIRANKKGWSVRCKLFNIEKYEDAVANCSERIRQMLMTAKDCEMHGGICKEPVSFSVSDNPYSKCRHSILFSRLQYEDLASVGKLIELESQYEE